MRIANGVSLGIAAAFLVVAPIAGMPVQEMLMHLGVGAAVLLAGMILFSLQPGRWRRRQAARALRLCGSDMSNCFPSSLYVTIFGGALALLLLAYRRAPAGALPLPDWAMRLHEPRSGMPYGLAIAAGALAVYPLTSLAGVARRLAHTASSSICDGS